MFPKGRFLVPEKGLKEMPGDQNDKCPQRARRLGKIVQELSDKHTGEQRNCGVGESGDTVNQRAGRKFFTLPAENQGLGAGWNISGSDNLWTGSTLF